MKILECLKKSISFLKLHTNQSIEESNIEANSILIEVLNLNKATLYKNYDHKIDKASQKKIEEILELRKNNIPLSYILNSHTFYNEDFYVDKNVLIPRPETEYIINDIIKYGDLIFREKNKCTFLDAGTGSGCVGITIANMRPAWNILLSDLHMNALIVAKVNSKIGKNDNINLICADWLSPYAKESVHFIFSNPPYVPVFDKHLDISVEKNEPDSALFSGIDGLKDIRKIILCSKDILSSGGILFLENGIDQSNKIASMLELNDFTDIEVHMDYNGVERFTSSRKNYG
tara:strand:+ start:1862 stop:2728 length:867 start_codon:yes stop_codon:yes gene_type:complete